jgi:hypothetical protein
MWGYSDKTRERYKNKVNKELKRILGIESDVFRAKSVIKSHDLLRHVHIQCNTNKGAVNKYEIHWNFKGIRKTVTSFQDTFYIFG